MTEAEKNNPAVTMPKVEEHPGGLSQEVGGTRFAAPEGVNAGRGTGHSGVWPAPPAPARLACRPAASRIRGGHVRRRSDV